MPRRKRVHPDALLLTYQEAAWVLGCTSMDDFLALIERGLIEPVAPGQVPRGSVIDLALSEVY